VRDLTVGEAAARLSAEFPGLTVSWLRRMEAAGRVSPRRNPAGFRRYTEADLDRIRAVLIAAAEADASAPPPPAPAPQPTVAPAPVEAPAPSRKSVPPPAAEPEPEAQSQRSLVHAASLKRESSSPSGGRRGGPGGIAVLTVVPDTSPAEQPSPAPDPPEPAARRAERRWPDAGFFAPDLGEVAMDRDRLAAAARIERGWIDELVGFGLLPDRAVFSGADLLVARACAELAELGFEPRHLRPVLASAGKVAELAAAAPAGRSAQAAAAAVRLHSTLVRAELLRG
jgi:hypothetical protein